MSDAEGKPYPWQNNVSNYLDRNQMTTQSFIPAEKVKHFEYGRGNVVVWTCLLWTCLMFMDVLQKGSLTMWCGES